MSDVDIVFREALKFKNEKDAVDYIFKYLPEVPTDSLIKMWDDFLNYENPKELKTMKRMKKIQTGGTMASQLPYNSVFRGKITNLY